MVALALGLAGCSVFTGPKRDTEITRILWERGDQFVRIETQDKPAEGTTPPNDHPIQFRPAQIRAALSQLEFELPGMAAKGPLFNPPELGILSVQIANGLRSARRNEDVTFLVHTRAKGVIGGYTGPAQVSTGRVFFKDGILNIIFGAVRDSTFAQRYEANPDVVPVGFRSRAAAANTGLSTEPNSGVFRPRGMSDRRDWLQFFPQAYNSEPRQPETLKGGDARPAAGPAPVAGSVEDRLRQLERLRRDKLISEEEYQYTRAQILKGL